MEPHIPQNRRKAVKILGKENNRKVWNLNKKKTKDIKRNINVLDDLIRFVGLDIFLISH